MENYQTNLFQVENILHSDNNEGDNFLLMTNKIISKLDYIEIHTRFWYSGHGNDQYRIIGQLVRDNEVISEDRNLFPLAKRDFQQKQVLKINHGDSLLHKYKKDDKLFFYFNVSEGSKENELIIDNFKVYFVYRKKDLNDVVPVENVGESIVEEQFNSSISDDNVHVLPDSERKIVEELDYVNISIEWRDQGWGNRKGGCLIRLLRNQVPLNQFTEIFGLAEHHLQQQELKVQAQESFLEGVQVGDVIQFGFRVGGGGGHQLFIQSLKMNIVYKPNQKEQIDDWQDYEVQKEIEDWINQYGEEYIQIQQQGSEVVEQLPQLKKKVSSLSENDLIRCKICYSNTVSRVFDCGHAVSCESCFNECKMKKCPICRQKGGYAKKIYFV